jgi:hypothetical protein
VGLWNYIRLAAGDGPIPVFTAYSLRCYTSTVHPITASPLQSPLELQSLLDSLLETAALESTALESAALREE